MKYTKKYNIVIQSVNESFESTKIIKSELAQEYLRKIWEAPIEIQESFYALFLDRANKIKGHALISVGGMTGTVVDNRILFKYAVDNLSTGLIIAHNHPSGQLKPSDQDIKVTKKIQSICELFEIALMDHIILTEESFYSFADNGLI